MELNQNSSQIDNEVQDARNNQRLSIPAKRLQEKLRPITSRFEDFQKRWFWELLQNASDYNDEVSVQLELFDDRIVFKHNGLPFRPVDVENLIAPDSGKDDAELKNIELIGRFGSGFISTHILSSKVRIEGIIKGKRVEGKYYKFKFDLNRNHFEDKELLKNSILEAEKMYDQNRIETSYLEGTFNSVFTYFLDHPFGGLDNKPFVAAGLSEIDAVLPYTLTFMPKVQSVIIKNFSKNQDLNNFQKKEFRRKKVDSNLFNEIEYIKDTYSKTYRIAQFNVNETTVVIELKNEILQQYPHGVSKLFCALPLVGTSSFPLPFIVNSNNFKPAEDRDWISLSQNDKGNRDVLKDSLVAFSNLLRYCEENKIKNMFHLINWPESQFDPNKSEGIWYRTEINPRLHDLLIESKIVEPATGVDFVKMKELKLPYTDQIENSSEKENYLFGLFDLLVKPFGNNLPKKDEFLFWYKNVNFSRFKSIKYDLSDLVNLISLKSNLKSLSETLNVDLHWLKNVIKFTLIHRKELLDQHKIIPNQNGSFHLRKDEIFFDRNIPSGLILIYMKLTGVDYKNQLLEAQLSDVESILPLEREKNLDTIAKDIDNEFKKVFEGQVAKTSEYLESLRMLFKWLGERKSEEKELKKKFEWFYSKRAQLFMETFNDEDRDKAFSIVQSGKLQSLAKLAESNITAAEIQQLAENPDLVKRIISYIQRVVNDEDYADEHIGLVGEQIVFDELKIIFSDPNYQVKWKSKEGESKYDFEVSKNGQIILYIDAKTTNTGIANTDSIPFFMRMSQWNFLKNDISLNKYILARVFLNHGQDIRIEWLNIKSHKIDKF